MRVVNGKYNANPATVGDVLVNILNNFKLDQKVINVIIYIITNATTCDIEKQVSDFEPAEPSAEQLKKLNQDYNRFQQQHRFKTLQEFMSSADYTKCITPVKKVDDAASANEEMHYVRQKEKAKFSSPAEEYQWAITQFKKCSKCDAEKNFAQFNGNTSGSDAFDKDGYRLRRPECKDCTKLCNKGKNDAKKKATELGIPFKAPEGTRCAICNKLPTKGNGLVFDHCHEKNEFRGYCCNSCNRSIGVLGDNPDGILKVLNYLIKSSPCKIKQNDDGSLTLVE
jgi:hypothetical protein